MNFNISQSTTWEEIGWYSLRIEQNLNLGSNGHFGYDTVSLGYEGEGGSTLKNTTVGTIATNDFWLGIFGLHPRPTNFSSFDEPSPSYMTLLKEQSYIPSLSYGYTAGAQYRFTKVLSSLTLGGYDASRFVPNNISYTFAPDNERDLVVNLQKITMSGQDPQETLYSTSIQMFIDSTVAQIWLPLEACQAFEKAFGLVYDETTDLYLVNNTMHDALLAQAANVTFTIGPGATGGQTTDIVFPYAAFDQIASPPYRGLESQTSYFPLRRAANSTQYTFGRTFLQEAYLIVDHERSNFSVSQVSWIANAQSSIISIQALSNSTDSNGGDGGNSSGGGSSSGLAMAAIIGIAVGVGAAVVIAAILLFCLWRRRQQKRKAESERQEKLRRDAQVDKDNQSEKSSDGAMPSSPAPNANAETSLVYPKFELPANEQPRHEMEDSTDYGTLLKLADLNTPTTPSTTLFSQDGSTLPVEADGDERQIFEMEGCIPERPEADGRMLTEKDMMKNLEARYNGIDPEPIITPTEPSINSGSPVSATSGDAQLSQQPRQQRTLLTAADVAMVPGTAMRLNLSPNSARTHGWDGPVSPLTPHTPRALEETIISPMSPLPVENASERTRTTTTSDPDRRRFSYED